METVKISSKFQVVIPKTIREAMDIKAGQKFQVIQIGNRIQLIPLLPMKVARGFLSGIDTDVPREQDRI